MPTWRRSCSSICTAPFAAGNLAEAARLQALVDPLRQTFGLHTFPAVIKEAMSMIGYPAGPVPQARGTMPHEARQNLAAVLQKLRDENCLPPETAASVRA